MPSAFRLALFQPDIPGNVGACMRLCACLGVSLDVIEPCGFAFDDKKLRRAGMDYLEHLDWRRHESWERFLKWRARSLSQSKPKAAKPGDLSKKGAGSPDARLASAEDDTKYLDSGINKHSRLLLFTTKGAVSYTDFAYRAGDILLMGRESAGVPDFVHAAADHRLVIPIYPGLRSLNLSTAAAMALGEARRQLAC